MDCILKSKENLIWDSLYLMQKFLKLNAYLDELNDKTDVILAEMQEIKAEQEELNDEEEEVIAELETTENEIKELEKTFEDMLQVPFRPCI